MAEWLRVFFARRVTSVRFRLRSHFTTRPRFGGAFLLRSIAHSDRRFNDQIQTVSNNRKRNPIKGLRPQSKDYLNRRFISRSLVTYSWADSSRFPSRERHIHQILWITAYFSTSAPHASPAPHCAAWPDIAHIACRQRCSLSLAFWR